MTTEIEVLKSVVAFIAAMAGVATLGMFFLRELRSDRLLWDEPEQDEPESVKRPKNPFVEPQGRFGP